MSVSVESVLADVMSLPDDAKEDLLERLLADLTARIDPEVKRAQLEVVKRRRDELRSGAVQGIPGEQVLAEARELLKR
ncbi:MAG: addiction module protein [Armatimonadetes bacterium]|jgi:hypothetical protein|nr:addiction module protein [Armatimonadota bacterium]